LGSSSPHQIFFFTNLPTVGIGADDSGVIALLSALSVVVADAEVAAGAGAAVAASSAGGLVAGRARGTGTAATA
jgi:hypothetical protein